MKILLIDDSDDIRLVARMSLSRLGGMTVVEADGGEAGLRKAAEEKPDAILLDMMMPGMDGPSTLAALRQNPATASIPVIFLTAKAMKTEIDQLKALGALGVLTKPFNPKTLAADVNQLLGSA